MKTPRGLGRSEWQPTAREWATLQPLARAMRRHPTDAEHTLWQRIRKRARSGTKFRRQFAIDRFIVDFCSPGARLVVEIDGPAHESTREEDTARQTVLESLGFRVPRFKNQEVLESIEAVLAAIDRALQEETPPNAPLAARTLVPSFGRERAVWDEERRSHAVLPDTADDADSRDEDESCPPPRTGEGSTP